MNCVILSGRLTKDPDIRYSTGQNAMCISNFTLAVDGSRTDANGNRVADFIRCVAFGKRADWMQKYTHKGMKLEVRGRWQTGSYKDNSTGATVYTNECYCDEVNFGESKSASSAGNAPQAQQGGYQNQGYQQTYQNAGAPQMAPQAPQGGYQNAPQQQYQQQSLPLYPSQQTGRDNSDHFMHIPDSVEDEGLPFN